MVKYNFPQADTWLDITTPVGTYFLFGRYDGVSSKTPEEVLSQVTSGKTRNAPFMEVYSQKADRNSGKVWVNIYQIIAIGVNKGIAPYPENIKEDLNTISAYNYGDASVESKIDEAVMELKHYFA